MIKLLGFCANRVECGIPDFKGKSRLPWQRHTGWGVEVVLVVLELGDPVGSSKASRVLHV